MKPYEWYRATRIRYENEFMMSVIYEDIMATDHYKAWLFCHYRTLPGELIEGVERFGTVAQYESAFGKEAARAQIEKSANLEVDTNDYVPRDR